MGDTYEWQHEMTAPPSSKRTGGGSPANGPVGPAAMWTERQSQAAGSATAGRKPQAVSRISEPGGGGACGLVLVSSSLFGAPPPPPHLRSTYSPYTFLFLRISCYVLDGGHPSRASLGSSSPASPYNKLGLLLL